jgi:parvulin-like peptidyl-prolyl isomerase
VAAVILLAAGVASRTEIIEEIVARINDDIITLSRLKEREAQIVGSLFSRYSGEELDEKVREVRSSLVRDLIRETLMLQRADVLGLDTSKIVDVGLEQIKRQNEIKTNDELLKILREQGTTLDELREQILRINVPPIMVDREVRQKVSVSEAEIESYYKSNVDEFRIPETVTFSELVLRLGEEADEDEVRTRVEAIVAELETGASFDALVQKYSEVPSREGGGRVGPLRPKELARPIERALRSLEPGTVSPIIESRFGLHLLRLDERVEERLIDLAEERDGIEDRIRQEKTQAELEKYFEKLTSENFIRISPAYRNYPDS